MGKKKSKKKSKKEEGEFHYYLDPYFLSGREIDANKAYVGIVKKFRSDLITKATQYELHFKEFLDALQLDYAFQHPIIITHKGTRKISKFYIGDFYIPSLKLIIELDGSYHRNPGQAEKDKVRDAEIRAAGYRILRIRNSKVREYEMIVGLLRKYYGFDVTYDFVKLRKILNDRLNL